MRNGILISIIIVVVLLVAGIFLFSGSKSENNLEENFQEEVMDGTENSGEEGSQESPEEVQPQTYNIDIENFAFNLNSLTIKSGDTVVWTNQDSVQHTATSDSGNEIDSPFLSKGESYSKTFTEKGTFNYHCTPHPNMKGTIIVE